MDPKHSMTNDVGLTAFQGPYSNADPNESLPAHKDGPSNLVAQVKERGMGKITTSRSKMPNFSPSEDVFLVKSWLEISSDAATNTWQKNNRFWDRVLILYNSKRGSYPERTVRSLQSRWDNIKAKVGKFSGYMADVLRTDPSGMSDADKTSKAAATFADVEGGIFAFMHCWDIMKDEPKWMDTRHLKGRRRSHVEAYADHVPNDSNIVEQSPDLSAPTTSAAKRPLGRDATRTAHKKSCSTSTSSTAFEFAAKLERWEGNDRRASRREQLFAVEQSKMEQILGIEQEKLRFQREKLDFDRKMKQEAEEERILSIDLDTCTPALRIYYQARQEEILERIQERRRRDM